MPTWKAIIYLLRWHKPAGRLILMIPALWGVFVAAQGSPPWPLVGVMVLGALATSAAGCVINDLWDRRLDAQVERTKNRPLASRQLTVGVALGVLAVGAGCALLLATYLNRLSFALALAAVPVIALYPGAKRVFPVPQLVLSIAWGFAVLISWTAVTGSLDRVGLGWLWGATVLWTLGFDTVYALADLRDDERVGIQSSARFFGSKAPLAVGFCFLGTALCLLGMGWSEGLHWSFYGILALVGLEWGRQVQQLYQPYPGLYGEIFGRNVIQGFVLLGGMILGFCW
ncbi:MAG: 4-hydroxybenzoate solanesyltransferase [Thermostichales cyanobacterium DRC_bins_46]